MGKTITIIIEKSSDFYSAYAENCAGVYGGGATAEQAKSEALKGLDLLIKTQPKDKLPKILQGKYDIIFKYDAESFLKYYNKIFSAPALERLTGINQKQLHHYASGKIKPRPAQRKKIETAMHNLGTELLSVEL